MIKKLTALVFLFTATLVAYAQEYQIVTGLRSMDPVMYRNFAGNLPATSIDQLPRSIDLSQYMPPVGNQSPQNSCVAWAIAYSAQGYYAKSKINSWNYISNTGQLNPSNLFSPSFVYNQINRDVDEGSSYEDALQVLKNQGVSTMNTMPYGHYLQKPSQQARNEANNYKIKSFRRLGQIMNPVLEAKEQLAQGHPVIINALTDLSYFEGGFRANRPTPYIWSNLGNVKSGLNHAMLLVGYDDTYNAFKFVNSWGTSWGDQGYGWISYPNFNRVVPQSWIMIPSFGETNSSNPVVYTEKSRVDEADIASGLNLYLTDVSHMNSMTHPNIHFNNRSMRIQGFLSIPPASGKNAKVVIYFYHLNPDGTKGAPIRSTTPSMSLPNGSVITGTPDLQLNNYPVNNLGWFADIKYIAFDLPRGINPPLSITPLTHPILAEPALLIDNYPVRLGQSFRFAIIQ